MNITNAKHEMDDSNPIYIYIMLGIELVNSIIALWTSYKLQHLNFVAEHIECCGIICDDLNISISDSEEKIKDVSRP